MFSNSYRRRARRKFRRGRLVHWVPRGGEEDEISPKRQGRHLHKAHDEDRDAAEDDEVKPPEALAVVDAGALLAALDRGAVLGLRDLVLAVGHDGGSWGYKMRCLRGREAIACGAPGARVATEESK